MIERLRKLEPVLMTYLLRFNQMAQKLRRQSVKEK